MGDGDGWPQIRERVLAADILLIAAPTWLGQPSSVSKLVLERMDAMISEGPGPGDDYLDSDEGHEWSGTTGKAAAANLLAVARALRANPIPPPPS